MYFLELQQFLQLKIAALFTFTIELKDLGVSRFFQILADRSLATCGYPVIKVKRTIALKKKEKNEKKNVNNVRTFFAF